jgi:flavin reductase (DIM6/NTAB) family NADH-FMN oxidoreductase RutF
MLHSSTTLAESVGHIPSGLFIVAVKNSHSQEVDGYLASFIQQVSFNPILVSLAIKPGRPAYDLIKAGNPFAINIVGEHDKSYLKHFWKGYDPAKNPFSELKYDIGQYGGVILNEAKSSIECRWLESVKPGDHEVMFAEVLASYHQHPDSRPSVHIRKSGADY